MKKGYSIKCWKNAGKGFVVETLNKNSKWCIATNDADFPTLEKAREFFKKSNHDLRGSSVWIEGPKRGRHGLFK